MSMIVVMMIGGVAFMDTVNCMPFNKKTPTGDTVAITTLKEACREGDR